MQLPLPGFFDGIDDGDYVLRELDSEFLENATNAVRIGAVMSENLVSFEGKFSQRFCDSYRRIAHCWFLLAELYVSASVEVDVEVGK